MDIVFVDSLQLSANIGPDCWGRTRAQPLIVSIYLHLSNDYLTRTGETDDVKDSVHYGHLCKAVSKRLGEASFSNVKSLIAAVTKEAFELGGEAVAEVKVRVEMSKMILLAGGFSVEVITPAKTSATDVPMTVTVSDLTLATIIGVNAPEREAKQRVVTDIIFTERGRTHSSVDYQKIVAEIAKVCRPSMLYRYIYEHGDRTSKNRRILHWRNWF
jgi:FolB domain-containing protein